MLVVDWIVCKSKHGECNNNSWFNWICNQLIEKQDEYKYELIGDCYIYLLNFDILFVYYDMIY